ncbi:uncharacterized protein LOC132744420, partial [Ruditapes philippinarum]|uniref:uncharacterized protein LOC132744420 n=1 Tax=Ruditapes philippinarum TaxID=129788 RepID=UPI00295B6E90
YTPRLIEDRKIGTIKASSGCTSRDKQVSFEWIRISARSNVESTINRNISYKNTSCSTDSECGHYNGIEYTSIIYAKPSENGNFYLKVAMVYGNERIESRKSALKYTIDGKDNNNEKRSFRQISGFYAVFIIVPVFIVACVIIYKHRKCGPLKECRKLINNHNQAGNEKSEEETNHMEQDTLCSTEKIKRQKQKLIAELKELLPTKTQKGKDAIN